MTTLIWLVVICFVSLALWLGWRIWSELIQVMAVDACECTTPEYPHFAPDCPEHGKLSRPMSYDERQIAAVLRACEGCGREFYFTSAARTCGACR